MTKSFQLSREVCSALEEHRPVVALESTIIAHGMPYPQNLDTALELERTVRYNKAVPATIAILNGVIKIGLDESELEFISKENNILKASSRDIAVAVARKLNAATTVSATMACARMASIDIFATGGIGGVHRNASETFDISTDLTELGRTPVAVVSAGVKSVLDIGLTLEYLETLGVPVIGFGTDEFPAFFSRESGFKVPYSSNYAGEIAGIIRTHLAYGKSGILIANPIPEKYSMDKSVIDSAIDNAIRTADEKGIKGKEITPFLLAEIKKLTEGKSLESNIRLAINNAEIASKIAYYL